MMEVCRPHAFSSACKEQLLAGCKVAAAPAKRNSTLIILYGVPHAIMTMLLPLALHCWPATVLLPYYMLALLTGQKSPMHNEALFLLAPGRQTWMSGCALTGSATPASRHSAGPKPGYWIILQRLLKE